MNDDAVVAAFRRAAEDRRHGATEIEERLISDLLALAPGWTRERLSVGAGLLAAGHPAMAPLLDWADRVATTDPVHLTALLEERKAALKGIPAILAANAMPWIEPAARVVSISRSSAVAAVVEGAWSRGWRGEVVVLDGSSAGRGSDQAERLSAHGGAVSQPDASAAGWLGLAETVAVVGADAVGSDRFVNCIGTRALLELAVTRSVPTILVADSGKNVSEATIDGMVEESPTFRDGSGRAWPLFEAIPLSLVTARITD